MAKICRFYGSVEVIIEKVLYNLRSLTEFIHTSGLGLPLINTKVRSNLSPACRRPASFLQGETGQDWPGGLVHVTHPLSLGENFKIV